jgi:high-affinity K+ transport system ATPase subunit B
MASEAWARALSDRIVVTKSFPDRMITFVEGSERKTRNEIV